ncbi:MAG: septal ring lytic transglycosylase RlpA family protein, partial [Spirochaetes bacterium]|nr:septal ring lytic transglycosylase RlpA family protein [Candidatus Avitreponema avistercoris]
MKRKKWLAAACVVALLCSAAGFAEGQLYKENALASYYGEAFQGRPTSSGEIFDMYAMTAAHKTLPFGTMLEVTNLENGNSVVVRVNDRGPFVADREIDLSQGAAEKLGMITAGVARVSISILSEPGKETEAAPAGLPENEEVPAVAAAPRPEPRPEPVLR